jgi:threonine aldolase
VLATDFDEYLVRFTTHYHIGDSDIADTLAIVEQLID